MQHSVVHSHIYAENVRPFKVDVDYTLDEYEQLAAIGIGGYDDVIEHGYGMDTIQQGLTTPSAAVPLQFLQNWMPGHVAIATGVKQIDRLCGIATIGNWEDEQIVIRQMEMTGTVAPYSDTSNTPLTTWNPNYVQRTVVRMESGMLVGRLEEKRAARIQESSAALKRDSATLQLAIQRNQIGFYGYNSGNDNTYGMLNDPNLLSYNNATTDPVTSSTLWGNKTFQGIIADIKLAVAGLMNQSKGIITKATPMTLACPTNQETYLDAVTTDFGVSVADWIKKTYPLMRVESCPQFQQANGSANVFYLYADYVEDEFSTDDRRTWIQVVPAKFQIVGVQQLTKGYKEDYTMATAGVVCKRPFAVYRVTGI